MWIHSHTSATCMQPTHYKFASNKNIDLPLYPPKEDMPIESRITARTLDLLWFPKFPNLGNTFPPYAQIPQTHKKNRSWKSSSKIPALKKSTFKEITWTIECHISPLPGSHCQGSPTSSPARVRRDQFMVGSIGESHKEAGSLLGTT